MGTKRGRPAHEPTARSRTIVRTMAGMGAPQEGIAQKVGISVDTLDKYYRLELDAGTVEANAAMAGALYKTGISGNVAAQIFWLKTRAGWKETQVHELTGKDGQPIESRTVVVDERKVKAVLKRLQDEY